MWNTATKTEKENKLAFAFAILRRCIDITLIRVRFLFLKNETNKKHIDLYRFINLLLLFVVIVVLEGIVSERV